MKINQLVIIGVLAAVSGLSGCALAPSTVDIGYKPTASATKIQGANKVAVNVQVIDSRKEKAVGNKVNTYGMKMANILAKDNVDSTVQNAIEEELRLKGFNVASNSPTTIIANITKFYSSVYFSADADLSMDVKVNSSQINKTYATKISDKGHGALALTQETSVETALNNALSAAIKTLFDDKAFIATLLTGAPKPASN